MPPIQLTKRTIDALPLAGAGQVLYRDRELRGFGLALAPRAKCSSSRARSPTARSGSRSAGMVRSRRMPRGASRSSISRK